MRRAVLLYQSTIGKKAVAAVSGVILFLFLVLHVVGNLKVFLGTNSQGVPDIDLYAHFLRTMGEPMAPYGAILWLVRAVLLIALILHVTTVVQLAMRNRQARPQRYACYRLTQSTVPARAMLGTGLAILAFVVIHLLQFTTGTIDWTPFREGAVYANLYHAFHVWYIVLFYLVAMGVIASHLLHGVWSFFQTLGIDNADRNRGLRCLATTLAILLLIGFCSLPVCFYLGILPEPPGNAVVQAIIDGGA